MTEGKEPHMPEATGVDYDGLIPNNVGLNADPRLRRALESWHPGCLDWWRERGPEGCQSSLVYLRTAINVEEARHLWAMVYLLQKYFGRDGREEAEDLLRRRSGNRDSPRLLGAFNEATPDWLAFFMFTFFTDRDGKMQLHALAQSGFDPLSRTCRFMLTEEAHHMFIGQSGIGRVIERSCAAMREAGIDDPSDIERVRALGVVDLPTMQKKLNLHYSLSLDLFGSEVSTNAANAFNAGIKGRYKETQIE